MKALLSAALFATAAFAQQPLTLQQAEQMALRNHPRIAFSRATASAAHQAPAELRANTQPILQGNATGVGADSGSRLAAGALNNPVVYNRLGTGVTLSQVLTDFGRNRDLIASANLRAQALDQATETTRAQVLLATDRAYYNVLRAQSVLTVAQQTVNARQTVADQASALAQAQMKSDLDVSFARVNLDEARLLLASARNDLSAGEAELATAIGASASTQFTLAEEPMPDAPPAIVEPLLTDALRNRPELADLRLEHDAAERFLKAETELWRPTVSLAGSAGFVPAGQDAVPGRYGAVGVNLNIPILNGGLFRARREEAEFRAQAAEANLTDVQNQVGRDVRIAYLNAQTAYERVGLTGQLLTQAQLALDLAQRRYNLGLSSIVELSQAQLSLTSAQISQAAAKYQYQQQLSALRFQTGTLR